MNNTYISHESFLVVLDSRNATTYNNGSMNSDITFEIANAVVMSKECIEMKMVVSTFTCPISFYQINSTNCLIQLSIASALYNYNMPYGNYNVNTFISTLLSILPSGFTLTTNLITNRFTMGYTQNFTITALTTMYDILGLPMNTAYSSTSLSLQFPYVFNMAGLNSLNIVCANVSTKNIDSHDSSVSSILAAVPINGAANGMIYYDKKNDFDMRIRQPSIDYFDIELQDDLGNLIDLNNKHFNLVLQITMLCELPRMVDTFHSILDSGISPTFEHN
jgi:hypothetical protein